MSVAALLSRLEAAPLAADPNVFASIAHELIRAFSLPADANPPRLSDAQADTVLDVAATLLQSPSAHFACLGYALVSARFFFESSPCLAVAFYSRNPHGAWLAMRPVDTFAAKLAVAKAAGKQPPTADYGRVLKAFLCYLGATLDHVQRGTVAPSSVQPCLLDAVIRLVTSELRGSRGSTSLGEGLALLQSAVLACPKQAAWAGVLQFLLRTYVDHEGVITVDEVVKTLTAAVAHHGMDWGVAADLSPLFSPYLDVFSDPDERLVRARDVLLRLPRSWPGLFLLATTAHVGMGKLAQLIQLPGSTGRRVILIELFVAMLRSVAPHRSISGEGPWTAFVDRIGERDFGATVTSLRLRAGTGQQGLDFDLVDDEDEFRGGTGGVDAAVGDGGLEDDGADFGGGDVLGGSGAAAAPPEKTHHSRDVIAAAFLTLLNHIELPQRLMDVVRHSGADTALPESAALLMQQVLVLEHGYVAPATVNALTQRLDTVLAGASLAQDPFIGALTTKLYHLVAYGRDAATASTNATSGFVARVASGVTAGAPPGTAAPSTPSGSTGAAIAAVRSLIKASFVNETMDHDRWNFGVVIDMCRGPLRHHPAAFGVGRDTRFFDRLLQFYRPCSNDRPSAFSQLSRRQTVSSCGAAGMALLDFLISSPEGTALLMEYQIPLALRTSLCRFVTSSKGHADLVTTMAGDYLRWLGHLSRHPIGLALLHSVTFFDQLTDAFRRPESQREVKRAIINSLHFGSVAQIGVDEAVKRFLSFVIASGDSLLRLATVARLERFVKADLWAHAEWVLDVLLTLTIQAVRDPSCGDGVVLRALSLVRYVARVSANGLKALAASHIDNLLDIFSWSSPLAEPIVAILHELLRVPAAAEELIKRGWVSGAIAHWSEIPHHGQLPRWIMHLDEADVAFNAANRDDEGSSSKPGTPSAASDDDVDELLMTRRLAAERDELLGEEPLHLCGALAACPDGAEALASSPLFKSISQAFADSVCIDCGSNPTPLRAALIAFGYIAAEDHGHSQLVPDSFITTAVELTSSHSPALRAAAITALSMAARSQLGRERIRMISGLNCCAHPGAYTTTRHAVSTAFAFSEECPAGWLTLERAQVLATDPMPPQPSLADDVPRDDHNIAALLSTSVNVALNAKRTAGWASMAKLRLEHPTRFLGAEAQKICCWFLGHETLHPVERVFVATIFDPSASTEAIDTASKMKR